MYLTCWSGCVSPAVFAGAGAAVCVGLRRGRAVRVEQRLPAAVSPAEPQRHRWGETKGAATVTTNVWRASIAPPPLLAPPTPLFAHKLINVVIVFWHFAGITALIELPKNCIAAAMDKEIGERQIFTRLFNKSNIFYEKIDEKIIFFSCSDLQADGLDWFLFVSGWDPLSVRPPGPDSSSHQRQRSVRRFESSVFEMLRNFIWL